MVRTYIILLARVDPDPLSHGLDIPNGEPVAVETYREIEARISELLTPGGHGQCPISGNIRPKKGQRISVGEGEADTHTRSFKSGYPIDGVGTGIQNVLIAAEMADPCSHAQLGCIGILQVKDF